MDKKSNLSFSHSNSPVYENVHLVCWDFDKTILSCHSHGAKYFYTPEHRAQVVQKLSQQLSPAWVNQYVYLRKKNIPQAIVTFADSYDNRKPGILSGEALVRAVIRPWLGDFSDDLLVWGLNPCMRNKRNSVASTSNSIYYPVDKSWHLNRAMEMYCLEGHPEQVMLVDDSLNNVVAALANGHPVWHVQGESGFQGSFKIRFQDGSTKLPSKSD